MPASLECTTFKLDQVMCYTTVPAILTKTNQVGFVNLVIYFKLFLMNCYKNLSNYVNVKVNARVIEIKCCQSSNEILSTYEQSKTDLNNGKFKLLDLLLC